MLQTRLLQSKLITLTKLLAKRYLIPEYFAFAFICHNFTGCVCVVPSDKSNQSVDFNELVDLL
jgi:hypothetical protein